jgi:N-acetylneuraminate synthase
MKSVKKDWGEEIWFANNELYCGKELVCRDEIWSSKGKYHYHPIKDETFYVLEGDLVLDIEGEELLLDPMSNSVRIKPGTRHRFRSVGSECRFIEVSTTHSDEDSIRVESL